MRLDIPLSIQLINNFLFNYNLFALSSRYRAALSSANQQAQYLQNSAENAEWSVLALGSLCLPYCDAKEKLYISEIIFPK